MKKSKKLFLTVLSVFLLSGVFSGIANAATFDRNLNWARPINANPWGIARMEQPSHSSHQLRVRVAQGESLAHNGTSWATTTTGRSVTTGRYTATTRNSPIVGKYQSRLNGNLNWFWHQSIIR